MCVHAPLCVAARGGHPGSCSTILCLISLKQGLSLKLELGWLSADPTEPPVPASHTARFTGVRDYPAFYMGAEDLNSGPHVCRTITLIH